MPRGAAAGSRAVLGGSAAGAANGAASAPGASYAAPSRATWIAVTMDLRCKVPRSAITAHSASCGELAAVDDAGHRERSWGFVVFRECRFAEETPPKSCIAGSAEGGDTDKTKWNDFDQAGVKA